MLIGSLDKFDCLLCLILPIALLEGLVIIDDEADVLTLDLAKEQMRVVHKKASHAVNDHIIRTAINTGGSQGYHREAKISVFSDFVDVISKMPIIDAEITPPGGNKVSLINNHQA